MNSIYTHHLMIRAIAGSLLALVLAGCTRQDEPRRYQVPKEDTAESVPDEGPLASIPSTAVARTQLEYDVPEGWKPSNASGMRKAAFVIEDGDQQVEVTAIDLIARGGDLLPNVNRWRDQIQLGEIDQAELDKSLRRIPVDDLEGDYVELLGPEGTESRQAILAVTVLREGRAWFFKLSGDAELAEREKDRFEQFVQSVRFLTVDPQESAWAASGDRTWSYEVPEGWEPAETEGVREAAFRVADGDREVNVNFLVLPAAVEKLLPNVNLWRRQVNLPGITQDELDESLQTIPVAGLEGHYIELVGPESANPRQAILVAVVKDSGQTWLIRLKGDADLALREKDRFQAFVKSLQLAPPDVTPDGD